MTDSERSPSQPDALPLIVLSYVQVMPLLQARKNGLQTAQCSPDLGLSKVDVQLTVDGIEFPLGERLSWVDAETIVDEETKCFTLHNNAIDDIAFFSEHTNWMRTLYPTQGAPTMLVSGISMHRIKGIDPYQDTLRKIKPIAPVQGRVLDTATGLGYTAIEAAKTAAEVVTIELDPVGLDIARLNPWSRELFVNPKIKQIVGDAFEEVQGLEDGSFSRVVHDPPMFSMAGDLYSGAFYKQLYRVLRHKGRLFHYIGDLDSPSNRTLVPGILRRLKEAGFTRTTRHNEAFGIVAHK
jgi:predicted methyltransferase